MILKVTPSGNLCRSNTRQIPP